jgi:hypothetical protein
MDFKPPKDAPIKIYEGQKWCQLYDATQHASYWYCIPTQFAQWHEPGTDPYIEDDSLYSSETLDKNDSSERNISTVDSGYESGGALTDYSTENYESGGEFSDSEYGDNADGVWLEYWDEQAQAKYWFNNNSVRIFFSYVMMYAFIYV